MSEDIVLFIANPSYDLNCVNISSQLVAHSSPKRRTIHCANASSALTYNFNQLWTWALNDRKRLGLTHFLMIHSDIRPLGPNWLDIMFEEMEANEADVLSAIVPIKTDKGVTSTAFDTNDGQWGGVRLTQRQALSDDLPDTWTAENLLLNTGLMLVDFRKPWVEQICFTVQNRIDRTPDGRFIAKFEPEDWRFSRQCRELGVKLFVTRKVVTEHYGVKAYRSNELWGSETDPDVKIEEQTFRTVEV